jgi:biotin transport system substrate-specific component
LRALATWSGAIAGLLLIVAGGLIPAFLALPSPEGWSLRPLGITLQVPALLLTALVAGPRSALLAAVGYLSVGLFQLPVFQQGGGIGYLDDPLALTAAAAVGLLVLQLCGLLNLLIGALAGRWGASLVPLLVGYGLAILPQALLCCAAGVLAWVLRRVLLVRS